LCIFTLGPIIECRADTLIAQEQSNSQCNQFALLQSFQFPVSGNLSGIQFLSGQRGSRTYKICIVGALIDPWQNNVGCITEQVQGSANENAWSNLAEFDFDFEANTTYYIKFYTIGSFHPIRYSLTDVYPDGYMIENSVLGDCKGQWPNRDWAFRIFGTLDESGEDENDFIFLNSTIQNFVILYILFISSIIIFFTYVLL